MKGELPPGWATAQVDDVITGCQAGFASGQKAVLGGIPQLRMNNIGNEGGLSLDLVRTVPPNLVRPQHELKPDDVLVCTTNSATLVGKPAVFNLPGRYVFSNHLTRLRPHPEGMDGKLLRWWMWLVWQTGGFNDLCKHWVNQSTIPKDALLEVFLPLPPLAEQRRIVAKLEILLGKVDACRKRLDRIPTLLKRFRQAILAAACSGKLTADWREENPAVEPAGDLLTRLQQDRQAMWTTIQERRRITRGRYEKPTLGRMQREYDLPPSWVAERLDAVLAVIEAGKSFTCEERPPMVHEVGVLKVSAVSWGHFDESETKTCLDDSLINHGILVRAGDFLFSRANTIDLVGASVIVRTVSSKLMLSDKTLRLHFAGVPQRYILHMLRSPLGRREIENLATGNQNSMRNIGQDRIRRIVIPFAPLPEQHEIVRRIDALFSLADRIEARYATARAQVDKLTQSILAKAFRGDLVPQDPNDEPASALLARIKASRLTDTPSTGSPRRDRPSKASPA